MRLRDQLKRLRERNRNLQYQINYLQDLMWLQSGGTIAVEPPKRKEEPVAPSPVDDTVSMILSDVLN